MRIDSVWTIAVLYSGLFLFSFYLLQRFVRPSLHNLSHESKKPERENSLPTLLLFCDGALRRSIGFVTTNDF